MWWVLIPACTSSFLISLSVLPIFRRSWEVRWIKWLYSIPYIIIYRDVFIKNPDGSLFLAQVWPGISVCISCRLCLLALTCSTTTRLSPIGSHRIPKHGGQRRLKTGLTLASISLASGLTWTSRPSSAAALGKPNLMLDYDLSSTSMRTAELDRIFQSRDHSVYLPFQ